MDENSPNKMSEGDNPNDFHAKEVIEYLNTASDFEKNRVAEEEKDGQNRSTVLKAAEVSEEGNDEGDPTPGATDSEDHTSGAAVTEDEDDEDDLDWDTDDEDEESEEEDEGDWYEEEGRLFPHEGYDPAQDPDVPSTVVSDNIRTELRSGNGSKTLKAVKDAVKNG